MEILQSIVYGIVQGLAEFLPISSTAHLVLIPKFFHWTELGVSFDVALHLGTALALIVFFFKDWISLISSGFVRAKSQQGKLFWYIVLATIPGAIAGLALDKYVELFRAPLVIGIMLIIMGFILYYADKLGKKDISMEKIGFKRSILVGISQVFAIIPGVSRSGITMSAGRMLGITREGIAKFTFLLSTPILLADGLYHVMKLKTEPVHIGALPFVLAIIVAAVVGVIAIKFLLNFLKTKGFLVFAVYRFVLGAIVIIASLVGFIS